MSVDTFADARALVEDAMGIPTEPWGAEDDDAFRVYEAPDGDPITVAGIEVPQLAPWDLADAPVILVDKTTGDVTTVPVLADLDRFTSMSPVGDGHPDQF